MDHYFSSELDYSNLIGILRSKLVLPGMRSDPMTTTPAEFFTDQTIQSLTKVRIVSKYFKAWAKILGNRARKRGETIRYVDLFAGRGCYADGTPSTPLLVLQHVIATPELHDLFIGHFNDADQTTVFALEQTILALDGLDKLKYQPKVQCMEVNDEVADWYEAKNYVATLTFIDPFGYAGLSARLIQAALKDQGSECIFFFNFNRVNAAIGIEGLDSIEEHIRRLFDATDAQLLREELKGLKPRQREEAVVKKLVEAIKRKHAKHVLHFRFLNDDASRASHYLVFATKEPLGAKIMKDILGKESSWTEGGTPGYECSPKPKEASILDCLDPVDELADELDATYAGQVMTVAKLYLDHALERAHTPRQYKDALLRLEAGGKIRVTPSASERREGTMADHVQVQFLPKAG
jgi:three-Cys-motif partner protein